MFEENDVNELFLNKEFTIGKFLELQGCLFFSIKQVFDLPY